MIASEANLFALRIFTENSEFSFFIGFFDEFVYFRDFPGKFRVFTFHGFFLVILFILRIFPENSQILDLGEFVYFWSFPGKFRILTF